MKRNILIAIIITLTTLFVSCIPQAALRNEENEHVELYFGCIAAKAVDNIMYDSSNSAASWGASTVLIGDVNDYYWSYTAVKTDKLYTDGQVTTQTAFNTGKGLDGSKNFSRGGWKFNLYAYKTADARTAGKQWIYSGEKSATYTGTTAAVSVPMSYAYIAGTGTASISFETAVSQEQPDTAVSEYKITKVEAVVGDDTVTLSNTSGSTWSATKDLVSGVKKVGLKVYFENESTPTLSKDSVGTAYILHGLTTEITGAANISFVGRTVKMSFDSKSNTDSVIAFNLNGGTLADGFASEIMCNAGDAVTLPTVTRTGYTFKGWKLYGTDDSAVITSYTSTAGETIFEAVWEANPCTITLDLNGGSSSAPTTIECYYDDFITPTAPTRSYDNFTITQSDTFYTAETGRIQYTFKGWKVAGTDDSAASLSYKVTGDATLSAVWEASSSITGTRKLKISVGSLVTLGSVSWKVLNIDTTNGRALLISDKVLTTKEVYSSSFINLTWSKNEINTYLNSTASDGFVSTYNLSSVYSDVILSVSHSTEASNEKVSVENTSEKIFLLSVTEANTYFASESDRIAYNTSGTAETWWLRTPGTSKNIFYNKTAFVTKTGKINTGGGASSLEYGVRPACYVNISDSYKIGKLSAAAGGYLFYDAGSIQMSSYVDSNGNTQYYLWRYLATAPLGETCIAGNYRTTPTGENLLAMDADTTNDATGNSAIGRGRMNTSKLVNAMKTTAYTATITSETTTTDSYAAKACADLTLNGYDDWFLPSIQELYMLYTNLTAHAVRPWTEGLYWSSSLYDSENSWLYYFSDSDNGYASTRYNAQNFYVIPIRAF